MFCTLSIAVTCIFFIVIRLLLNHLNFGIIAIYACSLSCVFKIIYFSWFVIFIGYMLSSVSFLLHYLFYCYNLFSPCSYLLFPQFIEPEELLLNKIFIFI